MFNQLLVYLLPYIASPCATQAYTHEGVGVGILGTGWGVKVQVPRFREAGLRILALYSRDKDRGNQIAEKVSDCNFRWVPYSGLITNRHSFSSIANACTL
jgi:hypothetical protein